MRIIILLLFSFTAFSQSHLPCIEQSEYTSNWQFIGPINPSDKLGDQHAGAISSISVNPNDKNEIYIGGMSSGLFHSTDRGRHWNCITESFPYPVLGVSDIHVDYTKSPHQIMIATGSSNTWYDAANFGILHSNDNGLHWQQAKINSIETFNSLEIKKIIPTENNDFYAYGLKEILRSQDNGYTWDIIYSPEKFPSFFYNKEFQIISMEYIETKKCLYFSTRANPIYNSNHKEILIESDLVEIKKCNETISNSNFIRHTQVLKDFYENNNSNPSYALKISKGTDEILLIDRTFVNTREHAIYHFDTKKNTVIKEASPNNKSLIEDIYWRKGLIIHEKNPAIQYMLGNILYKSIDSGLTFTPLYGYSFGNDNIPHADIRSCLFISFSIDGLQDEFYLGTDGGLSYTNDGGKTFENLNGASLSITQFFGLGSSPFSGAISVGSQDNSIMTYLPQTKTWVHDVRGDGYDVEYSKLLPGEAFGQYNARSMMRTLNDKAPFENSAFIEPKENASNKKTIATHRNGSTFFGENQFDILRSGQEKWERNITNAPHNTLAFAVSESDSDIVYLSSYWNKLFKSTDGGKSFKDISADLKIGDRNMSETRIHAICISPTNPDNVWISLGYFGDYYNACTPNNRVLYSSDGGSSWQDESEGLPTYYVSDIVYLDGSNDALFAACFEGIFFKSSKQSTWKLYSTNFPKTIVSELNINFCRGKLIASTYGRGLWETDLPEVSDKNPMVINKTMIFETASPYQARYETRDIVLRKKGKLYINTSLHMAKGKSIFVKNKKQVILGENGRIVNECGEKWGGIIVK